MTSGDIGYLVDETGASTVRGTGSHAIP